MHSLTLFYTHFAPVCADKVINFHISLFQNLRHMNSNKKPSQINFLWINIWKYGMPNRESKEGFTKFIFCHVADAFFNYIMHPCILHLFLRIYWFTFPWAFCKMRITWTQSRNHNRLITCEAAYVNTDFRTGNWRRTSQSLYFPNW